MMPLPKNKTHCRGTSTQDVLGNLPENVLDDILMCLPLRDAVRTSILSKKWRYKWCRLPQLTVDETLTKGDLPCLTSNFTKIVYQHILTFHVGPITKFTLNISSLEVYPDIDDLICFLSRNDIQHLVLDLPSRVVDKYKLPSSFFRCLQLRHLTLRSCLLVPPLSFKGFNRLISLELRNVTISSENLKSLISHCPMLEQLRLEHISCVVIDISAPMLRSFHLEGFIRSICLKNLPLLAKLSLKYVFYMGATGKCNIAKFFESLSALEHLYLDCCSLKKFLAAGTSEISKRLPFDLHCVKRIYLSLIYLRDLEVTSAVVWLIRSFPQLECLDIELCNYDGEAPDLECLEMEAFSDVTFNHLRKVKLREFIGIKPEMQFIKVLLSKSPVLVRMIIRPFMTSDKLHKLQAKISRFQRASAKAEVVYVKD